MEKERKGKFITGVLSVLLIGALSFSAVQIYQDYSLGDQAEREELLAAAMWEISKDFSAADKKDIKEIRVLKDKSGVAPLNYDVAVNMNSGKQILYSWKDKSKTEVWNSN